MKNNRLKEKDCIKILQYICNTINHMYSDYFIHTFYICSYDNTISISLHNSITPYWEPAQTTAYKYLHNTILHNLQDSRYLKQIIGNKSFEELLIEADLNS